MNTMNTLTIFQSACVRSFHTVIYRSASQVSAAQKFRRSFASPSGTPVAKPTNSTISANTLYGFDIEALLRETNMTSKFVQHSAKQEVPSVWME